MIHLVINMIIDFPATTTGGLPSLLNDVPPLHEICNYARTSHWYELGIQLELDTTDLERIRTDPAVPDKLSSMFQLWLDKKAGIATRRQLLKALRTDHVGQNSIAESCEQELKRMVSTYKVCKIITELLYVDY